MGTRFLLYIKSNLTIGISIMRIVNYQDWYLWTGLLLTHNSHLFWMLIFNLLIIAMLIHLDQIGPPSPDNRDCTETSICYEVFGAKLIFLWSCSFFFGLDLVLNEQSKKAKENNLRMISMKHLKQLRSRTSKSVSKFKSHTKRKKTQKSKLDIEDALIPAVSPTAMSPLALTMKWLTGSQSKADVLCTWLNSMLPC